MGDISFLIFLRRFLAVIPAFRLALVPEAIAVILVLDGAAQVRVAVADVVTHAAAVVLDLVKDLRNQTLEVRVVLYLDVNHLGQVTHFEGGNTGARTHDGRELGAVLGYEPNTL